MQGFLVWDYEHRYEEAVARLAGWVRAGRLRYREEILDGLEAAPDAIAASIAARTWASASSGCGTEGPGTGHPLHGWPASRAMSASA